MGDSVKAAFISVMEDKHSDHTCLLKIYQEVTEKMKENSNGFFDVLNLENPIIVYLKNGKVFEISQQENGIGFSKESVQDILFFKINEKSELEMSISF